MQFEVPERIAGATPDSASVTRARERLAKSAAPVRALPSDLMLMLTLAGVLDVLAVLLAIPVGFAGLSKMTAMQVLVEFSLLSLLALVLAGVAVAQMIPGSRRVISPPAGALMACLLLSTTAALLFPDFATQNFVERGIPCLRLGMICALPGSLCIWGMMRRGLVVNSLQAATAGGALAGLMGIGVLALHCPIFNAAHIIVWHVAVLAVTAATGAVLALGLSYAELP